jgi:hypothetical protein
MTYRLIALGQASCLTQSKGSMFPEDISPLHRFDL